MTVRGKAGGDGGRGGREEGRRKEGRRGEGRTAVTAGTVAVGMSFGCLGCGCCAGDWVCGLVCCDFCLVFVAEAGEEGGFLNGGGGLGGSGHC